MIKIENEGVSRVWIYWIFWQIIFQPKVIGNNNKVLNNNKNKRPWEVLIIIVE